MTKTLDEEKRIVDRALRGTGFSSRTKGLWSYYRKGDKVLDTFPTDIYIYGRRHRRDEYLKMTFLDIAKKREKVPKNMQKAFAVYYLNQTRQAGKRLIYKTTRKTTLERWKKAIDIIDKIRR